MLLWNQSMAEKLINANVKCGIKIERFLRLHFVSAFPLKTNKKAITKIIATKINNRAKT